MLHLANSRESVSTGFLSRHLGISLPAAHRMLIQIRAHLGALDHGEPIGTPDREVHIRIERIGGMITASKRKPNVAHVLLIEADRAIRTIVLDNTQPHRVRGLLMRRVTAGVRLVTTCGQTARIVSFYGQFKSPMIGTPARVADSAERSCDLITAFLTSFRRGMTLQHQSVSSRYFWLFLKEYEFRFNRRERSQEIFTDMVARFPRVDAVSMAAMRTAYCDLSER